LRGGPRPSARPQGELRLPVRRGAAVPRRAPGDTRRRQGDGGPRNGAHLPRGRPGRHARRAAAARHRLPHRAGAAGVRDDGNGGRSRRQRDRPLGGQRERTRMSLPREFRSDNAAPVHPAVLDAIAEANTGSAGAYGNDPWTARLREWFTAQFGDDAEGFLVWNGTGANVTALRAMTRPWQAVITSEHAHINVDECGAPELLAGSKLI